MAIALHTPTQAPDQANAVLTRATCEAAQRLSIKGSELATILGVSPATVTRMKQQTYTLNPGSKAWELAVLLVRLYRSLDSITNGDENTARAWMHNPNEHLHGIPITLTQKVDGLSRTLAYVDAFRAPI
ncbi:MAG TPA: DUF2384 domain-containing protein [Gammaproteobacteria bacterium]|nr:DUF2384 domain-containing protein [Gammaproteobacteria bacterium]